MPKRAQALISWLAALSAMLFAWFQYSEWAFWNSWLPTSFDSIRWKSAKDGYPRYQMLGSLLSSRILVGMKRGKVLELLGEPDIGSSRTKDGECVGLGYAISGPPGHENDGFWLDFRNGEVIGCNWRVYPSPQSD